MIQKINNISPAALETDALLIELALNSFVSSLTYFITSINKLLAVLPLLVNLEVLHKTQGHFYERDNSVHHRNSTGNSTSKSPWSLQDKRDHPLTNKAAAEWTVTEKKCF